MSRIENIGAILRSILRAADPDSIDPAQRRTSDKTARAEFGLAQAEIVEAIRAGTLRYRLSSMHGNPWLRLLRREVEGLVTTRYGDRHLKERQAKAELARVNRELKRLRAELAALEERRSKLISDLGA